MDTKEIYDLKLKVIAINNTLIPLLSSKYSQSEECKKLYAERAYLNKLIQTILDNGCEYHLEYSYDIEYIDGEVRTEYVKNRYKSMIKVDSDQNILYTKEPSNNNKLIDEINETIAVWIHQNMKTFILRRIK